MRLKLQTDRTHKLRVQSKTRHFSLIEMEGGGGGGGVALNTLLHEILATL